MANIITAMLNEKINKKLNNFENINVLYDDIQYEEGLLEVVELEDDIDYLILNEKIFEEYNLSTGNSKKNDVDKKINKIIKKHKNIKIIFFVDKLDKYEEKFTVDNSKKNNLIIVKLNMEEEFIIENENLFVDKIVNIILQNKKNENESSELISNTPLSSEEINNYSFYEKNTTLLPKQSDFNYQLLIEENKKMKEEIKRLQEKMEEEKKAVDKNKSFRKKIFSKKKKEIKIFNDNNKRQNNNILWSQSNW